MVDLHLIDIAETFQVLKKFNMRLNLFKFAFKIGSKKFLEFVFHHREIDITREDPCHNRDTHTLVHKGDTIIDGMTSSAQLIPIPI